MNECGEPDLLLDHVRHDVTVLHVAGDERTEHLAVQLGQLAAHLERALVELLHLDPVILLERGGPGGLIALREAQLDLLGPEGGRDADDDLRGVALDPRDTLLLFEFSTSPTSKRICSLSLPTSSFQRLPSELRPLTRRSARFARFCVASALVTSAFISPSVVSRGGQSRGVNTRPGKTQSLPVKT